MLLKHPQAHSVDHLNLRGTDLLACLLAGEKRKRELEELAMMTTSVTDTASQPWITMGYYCQLSEKPTKAIHFAHKVRGDLVINSGHFSVKHMKQRLGKMLLFNYFHW